MKSKKKNKKGSYVSFAIAMQKGGLCCWEGSCGLLQFVWNECIRWFTLLKRKLWLVVFLYANLLIIRYYTGPVNQPAAGESTGL